uniref:EF-hand domain-containing protein n=1 Tax=Hippocampus comes TaxID=109280 RepID=A0A3Q2YZA1_HIPCM
MISPLENEWMNSLSFLFYFIFLFNPAFNIDTCRLMINMLDRDMSGTMGFTEFKDLWQALNAWKNIFMSFDRDRSGTVEAQEMQQAIKSLGYNLSPNALNMIMKRYSVNGRIPFDDFVSCCVRLRGLTDHFQRRDTSRNGTANFHYDDVSAYILCMHVSAIA